MSEVERIEEQLEHVKDQRSQQASFLDVVKSHQPGLVKTETVKLAKLNKEVSDLTQRLARVGRTC